MHSKAPKRSGASLSTPQGSPIRRAAATTRLATRYADVLYRPVPPVDVDDDGYPHTDNAPVESTKHGRVRDYLGTVMRDRFRSRPEVCVGADLGVFFERGNRAALVAPDFLIAFGAAGRGDRLSYKVWQEGKVPDLAREVLSSKTWRRDVEVKPGLYRDLGVREYWIVDVLGKLPTPIIGARLGPAGYVNVAAEGSGALKSDVLGLELVMVDGELRFRDPVTGETIPDYNEAVQTQHEAERRATAAEAELAALRRQLH